MTGPKEDSPAPAGRVNVHLRTSGELTTEVARAVVELGRLLGCVEEDAAPTPPPPPDPPPSSARSALPAQPDTLPPAGVHFLWKRADEAAPWRHRAPRVAGRFCVVWAPRGETELRRWADARGLGAHVDAPGDAPPVLVLWGRSLSFCGRGAPPGAFLAWVLDWRRRRAGCPE